MLNKTKNWALSILALLCVQVMAFAQDGILDIDIDLDTKEWYEKPIVWVGAVAVLLALVLISRRKA